jgi:hypothetical protein
MIGGRIGGATNVASGHIQALGKAQGAANVASGQIQALGEQWGSINIQAMHKANGHSHWTGFQRFIELHGEGYLAEPSAATS